MNLPDETQSGTAQDAGGAAPSGPIAWPLYRSTKTVRGARIVSIENDPGPVDGSGWPAGAIIYLDGLEPHRVDRAWLAKHTPQAGGWLVRYEDGYISWAPDEAFTKGNIPQRNFGLRRHQEPKYGINETGRIVNRATGEAIPDEEPVLIFRAKDRLAPLALAAYAEACRTAGLDAHATAVEQQAGAFLSFQEGHADRVRDPS